MMMGRHRHWNPKQSKADKMKFSNPFVRVVLKGRVRVRVTGLGYTGLLGYWVRVTGLGYTGLGLLGYWVRV